MQKIIIVLIYFVLQTLYGQNHKSHLQETDTLFSISNRIDSYLTKSIENGYSGSILAARDGKILISKGYGWADRVSKTPCSSSTVYNIGSITKQFTAAALLKLVEQKKIKLSDKLSKFYKDIPDDKRNITIHQLLTHTSGIRPSAIGFRYDEATKGDFEHIWFNSQLWTNPGTKYIYANANYTILADIIEKVSGESYATFLSKNLWKPSKLYNTGYKNLSMNENQRAHGYYFNYSNGVWKDWGTTKNHIPTNENHWFSIGKGDIESTVEDLYKWHLALENNTALNKETKTLLETNHVAEDEDSTSFYGYGWSVFYTEEGKKVVWHNGSNGIYFGNFVRLTDDDIVVIVLSNTRLNNDSENVAWEISKMILDSNYTPKPLTKLSYELVYDFMNHNDIQYSDRLPLFLKEKLGHPLSDKGVLNRVGFKLIEREQEPKWGLELLKLNVTIFNDDGNLWDSLGEAYFTYKQRENAIYAFNKALELGNDENCYWCENSENRLKQLRSN
jgi:CubicO group peptidase (beta-lactamase class C family)